MIRLHLPTPPSVNGLFFNVPGKGRVPTKGYNAWKKRATNCLWLCRPLPKPIAGPVSVAIRCEDKGDFDLDNIMKALLDFCVRHKYIEGDGRAIVRKITLEWADIEGVEILIEPLRVLPCSSNEVASAG